MSESRIARRYARALFRLSEGNLEQAHQQLEALNVVADLFEQEDAGKILRSPVMPVTLKRDLLEYALRQAQAGEQVRNLVTSMVDAGRVPLVPGVASAFRALIDEAEGTIKADIVSAVPLPSSEQQAIAESVGALLDKKVHVHPSVDPSLLGGFVVHVGQYRIDLSVKTKLDGLAQRAAVDALR